MPTIIIVVLGILALLGFGLVGLVFFRQQGPKNADIRGLMVSAQPSGGQGSSRARGHAMTVDDIEDIKRLTGSSVASRKKGDDIATKLFKAGYYTADDKRRFQTTQVIVFILLVVSLPTLAYVYTGNSTYIMLGVFMGAFIGYALPMTWLDRQVANRQEEVLYFLPLVIEQVSIGVSSSLDIGPCIAQIIQMATDRDAHNPVTEMFMHVEKLIKSGLNLEDSLLEVAEASGMSEIKHAFMFLAQCAKHGGEISKQLQELADSIMTQRQTQVEARITALPVKATGPLALVFAGFFFLLFAGLVVKLKNAFSSG